MPDDDSDRTKDTPRIAVVGPCGSGKSTLVTRLKKAGYNIRCVSQEHSYIPDMWQRISPTDVLIYLDVTLKTIAMRRRISWGQNRLDMQKQRLAHAFSHADFYLPTDTFSADEVAYRVAAYLEMQLKL